MSRSLLCRVLLSFLAAIILSSASHAFAEADQIEIDDMVCQRYAESHAPLVSHPWGDGGSSMNEMNLKAFYLKCMERKGYELKNPADRALAHTGHDRD